jgi:hypothetical protein
MKPDQYALSPDGPQRLSGNLQQRGSRMGLPTWGGFLFGVPFVGIGTAAVLGSMGILSAFRSSGKSPAWVLAVFGLSFMLAGLMVWGMAWKQFQANRERREAARRYPNEPALADYRWHPDGFESSPWVGALKPTGFALGLTVFLSLFNWWAFGAHGPWMVKGIVTLFDALTVFLWWQAVQAAGRALKFGHSRIVFTRFPYALGEPAVLRWRPSTGVSEVHKGTFTLRCVQEWTESSGSGKNRTRTLVHEALWSAQWLLQQPRRLGPKDDVELAYDLPDHGLPTQLSADRPVFWELEVKLDLRGLDFNETYLVPIYAGKAAPRLKPMLVKK